MISSESILINDCHNQVTLTMELIVTGKGGSSVIMADKNY